MLSEEVLNPPSFSIPRAWIGMEKPGLRRMLFMGHLLSMDASAMDLSRKPYSR
jgi:hypothetical protein